MAQFGQFALVLAFVVTAYSIIASLVGIRYKNDKLIASGRNAAIGTFVCVTTAILSLVYLFIVSDFSIDYVAQHSNRDLPIYFKISALWGGQEGSLMFWGWLLTVYSALVMIQNRKKHTAMMKEFHRTGTLWTAVERIIETPLFVDSRLTRMVQIADVCSYAIRRFLENAERDLFDRVFVRADRYKLATVGVRHFTKMSCECAICLAHG